MGFSHLFRVPRPQSFLYLMTLRTGAELITLSLLFNKISGLYGILAVLTGFHLSPLQISMYIYSLLAFVLVLLLFPHIRKQSPLQNLGLAWFYLLDSLVNAAYTAAFALTWFLTISSKHNEPTGPGSGMIGDTAGFTSPEHNVSSVAIDGLKPGQDTVVVTSPASSTPGGTSIPSFSAGVLQPESLQSMTTIILLWTLRIYFTLIMLSFARFVLRAHIATVSRSNTALHTGSTDPNTLENPFSTNKPEGQGWKGRLGRFMIAIGRSYFLDGDSSSDEEIRWMDAVGGKFRTSGESSSLEAGNLTMNVERERRRRSGTGPPLPPPNLVPGQPGMLSPDLAQQGVPMQNLGSK